MDDIRDNLIVILHSYVSQMGLADLRTLLDTISNTGDVEGACAQAIDDIPIVGLARITSTIRGTDLCQGKGYYKRELMMEVGE